MSMKQPFDLSSLYKEREAETRARHASVEWRPKSSRPVLNDDFVLDPAFDPCPLTSGRSGLFTASYDDLPVHVTLIEDGLLFGRGFFACDRLAPTFSAHRTYLSPIDKLIERLDTLERLEVESGPTYLVGANGAYRNHYHWSLQCLPSIVLLREVARERDLDYRIVLPPLSATRRRALEFAGIAPSECLELDSDHFLSNVPVLYSNATSADYTFQPSPALLELLAPFREACLEHASAGLPTRFYVSRRDAPRKRPIENEQELALALEARGYRELLMSELSLEDQVSVFAGAESIVGPHGAGLVTLMFAPPTARLVEIMPEHYTSACFFRLAQVRGMGYSQVLSTVADGDTANARYGSPLRVDVAKVLAALDRSEAARGRRAA